jgi:hypothetical protein
MLNSTWESRDLVVLEAAVKYLDEHAGHSLPEGSDLQELTGLSMDDVRRALLALDGVYLGIQMVMDGGTGTHWFVEHVYPNARLAVGQWPTPETLADRLVQALALAADKEPDEEKRGLLKTTASWFSNAGRDVLVDVTAAVINRQIAGG